MLLPQGRPWRQGFRRSSGLAGRGLVGRESVLGLVVEVERSLLFARS
ncbi:MAG: hypothetical protein HY744_19775 [Deltaproteobacteria bacterium]|nr:hypothetical protein [Deltaproteobacteria bacterium]